MAQNAGMKLVITVEAATCSNMSTALAEITKRLEGYHGKSCDRSDFVEDPGDKAHDLDVKASYRLKGECSLCDSEEKE